MPPSVHFGQRAFRASKRTTVGTATGILATLRRLFREYSQPFAADVSEFVPPPAAEPWAAWVTRFFRGSARVWAVPIFNQTTDGVEAVARLRSHGATTVVVRSETDPPATWEKGRSYDVSRFKRLAPNVKHTIEAEIGALRVDDPKREAVLAEMLGRAFSAARGRVVIELPGASPAGLKGPFGPRLDSTLHRVHPRSAQVFLTPSDHLLSFNSPEHEESGACSACKGLGRAMALNMAALVTRPERSMHSGAFSIWTEKNYKYVNIQHGTIEGLRGIEGFDPDKPWRTLPERAQRAVLYGVDVDVTDIDPKTKKKLASPRAFHGFYEAIARKFSSGAASSAAQLAGFIAYGACPACHGTRWSAAARALRVGSLDLVTILDASLADVPAVLDEVASMPRAAKGLVDEVARQARNLSSVGLGHLSCSRGMLDISGGESRRLRLARVLNSPLRDLLLLLDEPSRGLHDEDVASLARVLCSLGKKNTVVVSDHRPGFLRVADHLVDLGTNGGPLAVRLLLRVTRSRTRASDIRRFRCDPTLLKQSGSKPRRSRFHNIQDETVRIPLGVMTCVTGVSGSGKSSFLRGALVPRLAGALAAGDVDVEDFALKEGGRCELRGYDAIRRLVALDQVAPPPNKRSLVATFIGLGDVLRKSFAATPAAKRLGLEPSDFGINSGSGRCPRCDGLGEIDSAAGGEAPCPACGGSRFGPVVLSVLQDGYSVGDVLRMSFEQLRNATFAPLSGEVVLLDLACELGIGHIALGRRLDTLSGGEVQRLRICRTLARRDDDHVLFVLDEPASGLHPIDVERLGAMLKRMLSGGRNTVVLVEHNAHLVASSDYVVEFGPGSGPAGGHVVAEGPPAAIAKTKTATGRVLNLRTTAKLEPDREGPLREVRAVREDAGAAKLLLRALRGEDVEPPEGFGNDLVITASVPEECYGVPSLLQVGRLDHELATFLLDANAVESEPVQVERLATTWAEHPDAELQILPFMDAMQTWGTQLPASVVADVHKHLRAMDSELIADGGGAVSSARARGRRFEPAGASMEARTTAVRHAVEVGAGYVALTGHKTRILGTVALRLVSLSEGLVGPLRPSAFHLSRGENTGWCRACSGSGRVLVVDEGLLLQKPTATLSSAGWLKPEVEQILRWVVRLELRPFLARMTKEGLLDEHRRFSELSNDERSWLLGGYWRRTGPGSFLKAGKDPGEVSSLDPVGRPLCVGPA